MRRALVAAALVGVALGLAASFLPEDLKPLGFGWELRSPRLEEIVAFTVPGNARSRRVMEKLGMRHDSGDDFEHPRIPAGHLLRPHVLYRIGRPASAA